MMDGKKKILDLLQKGELTAKEAESFIKIYDAYEETKRLNKEQAFKRLFVVVKNGETRKVFVNIPLEFTGLLRTSKIRGKLESHHINIDQIIELINQGHEGTLIELIDESGDQIEVYVE